MKPIQHVLLWIGEVFLYTFVLVLLFIKMPEVELYWLIREYTGIIPGDIWDTWFFLFLCVVSLLSVAIVVYLVAIVNNKVNSSPLTIKPMQYVLLWLSKAALFTGATSVLYTLMPEDKSYKIIANLTGVTPNITWNDYYFPSLLITSLLMVALVVYIMAKIKKR